MFTPEVLIGIRWVHFVAGITWIGLLYWFNLVNIPFQRVLDPSVKGQVNPPLFTRALAWFRWSAVVTVTAGLLLIYGLYWQDGDLFSSRTEITIFFGGLLGVIMLANVWMVIWPNQRRVLAAMEAGQPPDPHGRATPSSPRASTSRCRSPCSSSWPARATTRWTWSGSQSWGPS